MFPASNYHSHPSMVAQPAAYLPTASFNQQLPGFPHGGIEAPSFGRAPHFPGFSPSQGGTLSQIINRTSVYDLTNGTDGLGNPLPDRLTDYLADAMFDTRVSEKELEDLLQNIRPDMEIPEKNREGTPAGLKSTLYLHQELALSWLKNMEDGNSKGGILADDMGLGKTISTLALMLSRPAEARPKVSTCS
jgi:SNF2 family DNA or RNA helicase